MSSPVKVCLGSMEFGRYTTEDEARAITQAFIKHGYSEIDTALVYVNGLGQEILGRMRANDASVKAATVIQTKVNRWGTNRLTRESINQQIEQCLKALQIQPSKEQPPIDILYLHAPDHQTPILETLEAMNSWYERGVYKRFGLSNYAAWEVAQIHGLCVNNGFVLPTVYQGMYNALTRSVEPELFPCLRAHNMCFYAYNPLFGGVLTGKYSSVNSTAEGNRFGENQWAAPYRGLYFRPDIFEALDRLRRFLESEPDSPSLTEVSLRWLKHHSALKGEHGDAIIIGASKIHHVEQNLEFLEKGSLSDSIVKAVNDCAGLCKAKQPLYFL